MPYGVWVKGSLPALNGYRSVAFYFESHTPSTYSQIQEVLIFCAEAMSPRKPRHLKSPLGAFIGRLSNGSRMSYLLEADALKAF